MPVLALPSLDASPRRCDHATIMPSTFSLRYEPCKNGDIWITIDGVEKFQLNTVCLADSILARAPSRNTGFSACRTNDDERIISFGFCDELCCPSTSAKVAFIGDQVFWTDIRHPISQEDPVNYEFDRDQYEAEINRVLLEIIDSNNRAFLRLSENSRPQQPGNH